MALDCVTITGADDSTDPKELQALSKEFPFVEWAILVGSRAMNRFPSTEWISRLIQYRFDANSEMNLSLHLCGKPLRDVAFGRSMLAGTLGSNLYAFSRVQLNWHGERQGEHVGENVLDAFCKLDAGGWDPQLIFQLDGVNDNLWRPASRRFLCSGLFDRSHGAGVLPGEWPEAMVDIACGWAGGLGPQNLAEEIPKIAAKALPVRDYWIDMETHVRSEDDSILDMAKVRHCLEICRPFVG